MREILLFGVSGKPRTRSGGKAEIFALSSVELYKSKPLRPGEEPEPKKALDKPGKAQKEEPQPAEGVEKTSEGASQELESIVDALDETKDPAEAAYNKARSLGEPPMDEDEAKPWVLGHIDREVQAIGQVLLLYQNKKMRKNLLRGVIKALGESADIPLKG